MRSRGCTSPGLMTRLSRVMITLFMLPDDMVVCRYFSSNNLQTRNNVAIFMRSVTIIQYVIDLIKSQKEGVTYICSLFTQISI